MSIKLQGRVTRNKYGFEKMLLYFLPLVERIRPSQMVVAHFSHTSVIRVFILLLPPWHFSSFLFYFINDTIFWASSSNCYRECAPRLHRALWRDFFPFSALLVSLGNSKILDDALANTLTSIPCSPKPLCQSMTFCLSYSSSFLLWPRSRWYEWYLLWNFKSSTQKSYSQISSCLFHATTHACSTNSSTTVICLVSHCFLTSYPVWSLWSIIAVLWDHVSQLFWSLPVCNSG